jgi:hypothetical protein
MLLLEVTSASDQFYKTLKSVAEGPCGIVHVCSAMVSTVNANDFFVSKLQRRVVTG